MAFNKRIIKKNNIINNIDRLDEYLNADSLIISDDFSENVVNLYNEGKSLNEIKEYINGRTTE
jgi:hypothetical protein